MYIVYSSIMTKIGIYWTFIGIYWTGQNSIPEVKIRYKYVKISHLEPEFGEDKEIATK
jgi:hypothetical protein